MIQDIFPHKLDNQFRKNASPKGDDFALCFCDDKALVRTEGELTFLTVSQWKAESKFSYLFSLDERPVFLAHTPLETVPEGYAFLSIRELRAMRRGPKERMFALVTGLHLSKWYRDSRFCGRCGHTMEHSKTERAMVCPECGYTCYPRIMPAVIVGVLHNNRILVTQYNRKGASLSALIAGFTEIGETLEETVSREVMEETRLKVKNIRYYRSQPWGIANDLLAGFYCDVDGDDRVRLDEQELSRAVWMNREEIRPQSDDFSLTNEMMMRFKSGEICSFEA